jgi:hexokinase
MFKNFKLPGQFPQRKILALDIGGTLAKVAFYLPKDDPLRHNESKLQQIMVNSRSCKPSPLSVNRGLVSL